MAGERVFLYMDDFKELQKNLLELDVRVDHAFGGVHPFAMIGETEDSMQHYAKECSEIQTILSIRKNFDCMLTRDPNRFESNFKVVPFGNEVEYSNSTEWLILSFSPAGLPLFRVGNAIYSQVYPINKFMKELQGKERIPLPFPKYFDWKYYADKFANICLENYDGEHIILIRTIPADWYVSQSEIKMTDVSMRNIRTHIRLLEDVFIERTHCHCIDDFLGHASNGRRIYQMRSYVCVETAKKIVDIIRNGRKAKYDYYGYSQSKNCLPLWRLNRDVIFKKENDNKKDILESGRHFIANDLHEIISDLNELSAFLEMDVWYTLSDYFRDKINGKIDIRILELYTKYFKLNMNDLLAVYMIYNHVEDKSVFHNVIQNICQNSDCYPINAMRSLYEKNVNYLKDYKYIDETLKNELNLTKNYNVYIFRLTETKYVVLNPEAEQAIRIFEKENISSKVNRIIEENLCCYIEDMENLSMDWRFYIQRSQHAKGKEPIKILFEDVRKFVDSLFIFDYEDILESENAFIVLKKILMIL